VKKIFFLIMLLIMGGVIGNVARSEAATIVWKGYTWNVRNDGVSSPGYGTWSSNNILCPDPNGYLTFKVTNPTGKQPVGCEMYSQKAGWGYGTYTVVVEGDLTALHKNIVFGGLFPFFYGTPYIEFDVCETSKWDNDYPNVIILHAMQFGTYYQRLKAMQTKDIPADTVQTHRLIWQPGKATFDSFIGEGTGGTNYFHTEITQDVPVPGSEVVVFNMWTYCGTAVPDATDLAAPETSVIIRDFKFTPGTTTTPTTTTKTKGKRRR